MMLEYLLVAGTVLLVTAVCTPKVVRTAWRWRFGHRPGYDTVGLWDKLAFGTHERHHVAYMLASIQAVTSFGCFLMYASIRWTAITTTLSVSLGLLTLAIVEFAPSAGINFKGILNNFTTEE